MDEIRDIYDTLLGQLEPEYAVPWVGTIFVQGKPCYEAYEQVLEAYGRLLIRLGETDDDPDVEIMMNALLAIQWELGREMFLCGMEYARRQSRSEQK